MRRLKPMLASTGDEALLDEEGFIYEPKLDGIRALLYVEDEAATLISRNDKVITPAYPELADLGGSITGNCVIDGEIVLYDSTGNPDFHALVSRHHRGRPPRNARPVSFAAFDLLQINGRELLDLPLEERKALLSEVLPEKHPRIETTVFTTDGRRLWEIMVARGQEGVVAKRLGSRYDPGRRGASWLKIKAFKTIDAVIVGFRSDRRPVSSLALGAFDETDALIGIGRVGTGFSDVTSRRLRSMLEPLTIDEPPVVSMPEDPRDIHWTRPQHVCEVRYLEQGPGGALRHPSFLRLRPDKDPSECRIETQKP